MNTRALIAFLAAAVSIVPAASAQWTAKEQPDLAEQLKKVKRLPVEYLGEPVRSARMDGCYLVPNPDGKSYDLLQVHSRKYGGPNTVLIADLGTGETKLITSDRYQIFHLASAVIAPNGKLFLNVMGKKHAELAVYDPATNEFQFEGPQMPDNLVGETHPMELSTDGQLVCGAAHENKAASVCLVDPETGKATAFDAVGPSHAPMQCWGYYVGADDTHIYIASGKVPWYLVAVDRKTGQWETLATTESLDGWITVKQLPNGVTATVTNPLGQKGKKVRYWLYQGKAIPSDGGEAPPWQADKPAAKTHSYAPQPEISRVAATPDHDGNCTIWWRPAGTGKRPAKADKPAGDEPPPPVDDAAMEADGWRPIRYTVPTYAQPINRLISLDDGRIVGAAGYEGVFIYDPRTNRSEYQGKWGLSAYTLIAHDGLVYACGYPLGALYIYDPAHPWTCRTRSGTGLIHEEDPRSNPRLVIRLDKLAGVHRMMDSAVANGKVYFGGQWLRNGAAGGFAWWDPASDKADGYWEPFSNYRIEYITAADNGKRIVVSTVRAEDVVLKKPKPDQGALFFIDTATNQIVGKVEPVAGAKGTGPIVGVGGSRVIGWTHNPGDEKTSILYGVDTATGKVEFRKTLPVGLPVRINGNQREPFDFKLGPDGMIWTFTNRDTLVRIDPRDATVVPVGRVSGARIAFSGRDLYLGGDFRRIKDIVPAKR